MFGLRNQRGSCWVNATLQAIFRIPELQKRLGDDNIDDRNPVETCIQEIWASKGDEGLKQLYSVIKTATMPAGEGIGDSHELLEFLCDKVPAIDKLMRFKILYVLKCNNCSYTDTKKDTLTEFSIAPTRPKQTVADAIAECVKPVVIPEWKCEACSNQGCTKQFLLEAFPQVLVIHMTSVNTSVSYPPVMAMNGIKYALFAIVCYNGAHWWTFGRDLPPGKPWARLDDTHVQTFDPTHFPLTDTMRLLMYYRLKE